MSALSSSALRLVLLCLLSLWMLVLAATAGAGIAPPLDADPGASAMVLLPAECEPLEALDAGPSLQAPRLNPSLVQPPVTNDDRTELFWLPEPVRTRVIPALLPPWSAGAHFGHAWLRPPQRPPRPSPA
jgi:hypothetical protein